jgi:hypothetical protein
MNEAELGMVGLGVLARNLLLDLDRPGGFRTPWTGA